MSGKSNKLEFMFVFRYFASFITISKSIFLIPPYDYRYVFQSQVHTLSLISFSVFPDISACFPPSVLALAYLRFAKSLPLSNH